MALNAHSPAQPNRVFSRTMIIGHVWDQSFEGLTNIVDVYVRHLRENDLRTSQLRRTRQIANTLLAHVGQTGVAVIKMTSRKLGSSNQCIRAKFPEWGGGCTIHS